MASAGVSRSGRVRKKSAKLIEMETKSEDQLNNSLNMKPITRCTPDIINDDINDDNPIEDVVNTTDSESTKPLNKKLKIKLSLNPKPVVTSDENMVKIEDNSDKGADSQPKKATIPPLKIPKSKIIGLLPIITPEVKSSEEQTTESTSLTTSNKTKKVKQNNVKTEVKELKPKPKDVKEGLNEVIEQKMETMAKTPIKTIDQTLVTITEKPIEETPKTSKVLKTPKRDEESAANRLFRQITSGVTKSRGNKRNKSLPIEDMTQISFDDDFKETSLIIETEEVIKTKPKSKRSRKTSPKESKRTKRAKNANEDKPKKKRNAVITAYMIWSKENRSKIQHKYPELDFADVSRKLGEIWQSMPEKDRISWKRKAQKLVTKGSSIISTGKPKTSPQSSKISTALSASGSLAIGLNNNDDYTYTSIDDMWEPVGTDPINVSSYLTLLGESLSTIGMRLKEHSGQIAVSGSLSVLLDSTLCAIGPLLCLTQMVPSLNGCPKETHKKTLDNIAYIMPGI